MNINKIASGDVAKWVFVIITVGVVAHQTGYDQPALKEGKKYYRKIKAELATRKLRRSNTNHI